MITKDIKISKLLNDYPESLDVLLRINPHFHKLKNKVLRKALAGRVTIEQAASIAGVGLEDLLCELNNSAGNGSEKVIYEKQMNGKKESDSAVKPGFLQSLTADKIHFLDVRPLINSGNDPLKDILAKAKKIKPGEILVVKNSFEPVPLYTVLGKKGFVHWTEINEDCYTVYFYKENESSGNDSPSYDISKEINEEDFENVIEIDVSDLQPPEPMLRILENLNRVNEKSVMLVHHHREPVLLYPRLEERGYRAFCKRIGDENYKILIEKKV